MLLKNWETLRRGYRFGVPTFYNNSHLGLDVIVPEGTPIYAWDDLIVSYAGFGTQGGNTIHINHDNHIFRIMHMQKAGKIGKYEKGEILGYVGNTGLSTAPHLHVDISKGDLKLNDLKNFIDPDIYFNNLNKPMTKKIRDWWNARVKNQGLSDTREGAVEYAYKLKEERDEYVAILGTCQKDLASAVKEVNEIEAEVSHLQEQLQGRNLVIDGKNKDITALKIERDRLEKELAVKPTVEVKNLEQLTVGELIGQIVKIVVRSIKN